MFELLCYPLIMVNYNEDDKKVLKIVGSNIRQLRNKLGYSQEELAFESNLDRSYIGDIERGSRNVSAINIVKIVHALKTDYNSIFMDINSPTK